MGDVFEMFSIIFLVTQFCKSCCDAFINLPGRVWEYLSEVPRYCCVDLQGECWNTYTLSFFSSLQCKNLLRTRLHLWCKKWMKIQKWKTL